MRNSSSFSRVQRQYISGDDGGAERLPRARRRQRPTALASSGGLVATAQSVDGWPHVEIFDGHGALVERGVLSLRQPSRRPVTAMALFEDGDGKGGEVVRSVGRPRRLLCVASRDAVLLYHLEDAVASEAGLGRMGAGAGAGAQEPPPVEPLLLASAPRCEVEHLSFDDTGLLVAMCEGQWVDILQITAARPLPASLVSGVLRNAPRPHGLGGGIGRAGDGGGGGGGGGGGDDEDLPLAPLMRLGGQGSVVVASCFLPSQPHILLTIAQDRTFRLTNLAEGSCVVYQSPVLCASNLSAISAHPTLPLFSVAAADGRIWVYELKGNAACREVWAFDLNRSLQRLERDRLQAANSFFDEPSNYHWERNGVAGGDDGDDIMPEWMARARDHCAPGAIGGGGGGVGGKTDEEAAERACVPLATRFVAPFHINASNQQQRQQHQQERGHLLVVTPTQLLAVDASSFDVTVVDTFCHASPGQPSVDPPQMSLGTVARSCLMPAPPSAATASDASPPYFFSAVYVAAFEPIVAVCKYALATAAVAAAAAAAAAAAPQAQYGGGNAAVVAYGSDNKSDEYGDEFDDATMNRQWRQAAEQEGGCGGGGGGGGARGTEPLSLFPSPHNFDIPPNSALRSSLRNPPTRPKHQGTATTRRSYAHESWEKPNRVQRGKVVDQPVTFHTRIKSSGYGATQPRIKLGGSSGTVTAGGGSGKPAGRRHPNPLHHSYPLECGLLTSRQPQHELPVPMDVPLVGLAYSSNAQVLAVASMDSVVRTLRLPVARYAGEGSTFVGHSGRLHSVAFSHDCSLLITASADKTACVWTVGTGRTDPALVFTHAQGNPRGSGERGSGGVGGAANAQQQQQQQQQREISKRPAVASAAAARASKLGVLQQNQNHLVPSELALPNLPNPSSLRSDTNRPFDAEIRRAEFFYMDRFVLLASGGTVGMYSFNLDAKETNDLKRLQGLGRYRLVQDWAHGGANAITSFSCCNSALSHLVVSAASDRTVHVLDAAVGGTARIIRDAHQRPVHAVALPVPSPHVNESGAAGAEPIYYDVFLTAAADGVVALWDLRADRCAARFSEHVNRRDTSVQASFSPCMRFIATGSEDRAAFLYDIRRGTALAKLQQHTDVVSCVAWNPLYPQLATASYDGRIHFFTEGGDVY